MADKDNHTKISQKNTTANARENDAIYWPRVVSVSYYFELKKIPRK